MTRPIRLSLGLVAAILAMAAQAILPIPYSSVLQVDLLDAGHLPLFAVFAGLVFWVLRSTWPGLGRSGAFVLAFVLACAVGLGTELLQTRFGRDAQRMDLVRNVLGAVAGLSVVFAVRQASTLRRASALGFALALVAVGLQPVWATWQDYRAREASFPVLCRFDLGWPATFLLDRGADWTVGPAPPEWATGRPVARIDFDESEYPALVIREPLADWRGYSALVIDLHSPSPSPVQVHVRVDDAEHDQRYTDRFSEAHLVGPGPARIRIPLSRIQDAPADRTLDLARIKGLAIFAGRSPRPDVLYLDQIFLSKE